MPDSHVGIWGVGDIHSYCSGYAVTWNGSSWHFDDTGEPLLGWGGVARPCAKCGAVMDDHSPDYCLGNLPGVNNACCGHGQRNESYIRFTNGIVIRDFIIEYPQKKD